MSNAADRTHITKPLAEVLIYNVWRSIHGISQVDPALDPMTSQLLLLLLLPMYDLLSLLQVISPHDHLTITINAFSIVTILACTRRYFFWGGASSALLVHFLPTHFIILFYNFRHLTSPPSNDSACACPSPLSEIVNSASVGSDKTFLHVSFPLDDCQTTH